MGCTANAGIKINVPHFENPELSKVPSCKVGIGQIIPLCASSTATHKNYLLGSFNFILSIKKSKKVPSTCHEQ